MRTHFFKTKIFDLELRRVWYCLVENDQRSLKYQRLRVIVNNNKCRSKQRYSVLNPYKIKLLIN